MLVSNIGGWSGVRVTLGGGLEHFADWRQVGGGGGAPFVNIMIERQINFNNISYNLIYFLADGFLHKIEVGIIF